MKDLLCIFFAKKAFIKSSAGTKTKYLTFLFLSFLLSTTEVAAIELISAPRTYFGELSDSGYKYTVNLSLPTPQVFVLQEITDLPGGKKNIQTIVGRWHQIRSGYILQLTNAHGYYRRLNVGAKDNLYLRCTLPSGKQYTCVLRTSSLNEPISIDMTGVVSFIDDNAYLIDDNTSLKYILESQYVKDLITESSGNMETLYFVKASCTVDMNNTSEERIKVTSIHSVKKYIDKNSSISSSFFMDNITQYYWIIKENAEIFFKPQYILDFAVTKSFNEGVFNLASVNGSIRGRFKLNEKSIKLDNYSNANDNIINELKKIRLWYTWGDIIELWSDNECVLVLEKDIQHKVLRTKKLD